MSVSKRVHIICESCFFPKIIFERSLRDLGGIVEAGNFWEFAIFFICFYMFLVTFILDMRKLRPCHESCDIRDLQARLSEFDSRHATRQHWQQSRSFLGSMQILCVEVWHYNDNRLHPTNIPRLLMSWRASKKFVVYLDLIQLDWDLQKLTLLMEEIKLEIHDTLGKFHQKNIGEDSEILHVNLCRMFFSQTNRSGTPCCTWHLPFTSLESSKVATSIYTMAVLSRSPVPQNHRYTDMIRYADTHWWMHTGYISFIIDL